MPVPTEVVKAYSISGFQHHTGARRQPAQADREGRQICRGARAHPRYRVEPERPGRSAYRQSNAKKGALRVFLDAVETGYVSPGSNLLIENIDRLSRDQIVGGIGPFLTLIRGITIVTLTERRIYSRER